MVDTIVRQTKNLATPLQHYMIYGRLKTRFRVATYRGMINEKGKRVRLEDLAYHKALEVNKKSGNDHLGLCSFRLYRNTLISVSAFGKALFYFQANPQIVKYCLNVLSSRKSSLSPI